MSTEAKSELDESSVANNEAAIKAAERRRIAGIDELIQPYAGRSFARSLRSELVDNGASQADAALRLLQAIGAEQAAEPDLHGAHSRSSVTAGADALDKFFEGASLSQCMRYGLLEGEELARARESEWNGFSLLELGRSYYDLAYGQSRGIDKMSLVGQLFTRSVGDNAYQQTSDFPLLLENIGSKSLDRGWTRAPVTWDQWTIPGTAQNFLEFSRPVLSKFGELRTVAENAPYGERGRSEKAEKATIVKKGELTSLTREAIINDSLQAFAETMMDLGEAANRTVNLMVYRDVIEANPTLGEDGVALFAAAAPPTGHNNLTTPGAAPGTSDYESMRAKMARQTDNLGAGEGGPNPLGFVPVFLLCPPELAPQARALVSATTDPRASATTGQFSTMSGMLNVIEDVALSDAKAWYLASNRGTVEVAGLQGRPAPTVERESGWNVDSIHWKVRIEAIAFARDYRGLQKNDGG